MSVCRLLAPFAPFVSDWIHRELTGDSVHLAPFVTERAEPADATLDAAMDAIRTLARLGRAAREEVGHQGSAAAWRAWSAWRPKRDRGRSTPLVPLLAAELNVKRVEFATSGDALVTLEAKPNFRSLGKKFGKRHAVGGEGGRGRSPASSCARSSTASRWSLALRGIRTSSGSDDLTIMRRASGDARGAGGRWILRRAIDPTVTPELRARGWPES